MILKTASLLAVAAVVHAETGGVSPADLLKPLKDSWPTYNGDYSGKRYSELDQINVEIPAGLSSGAGQGQRRVEVAVTAAGVPANRVTILIK